MPRGATPNPSREYLRPESSRNLVALGTDGTRRWRYEAPAGVFGPVPAADGVYATVGWSAGTHGVDNRVVRVVDGEQQWSTDAGGRYLNVLATADGGERWRFTTRGPPRATTTVGSRVYLGTEAGFLVALDG